MISKSITSNDLLSIIASQSHSSERPAVIGIAGGSASGKTTIAQDLTVQLANATLFSQDLFQLGSDFQGRKTSPYKWDDPENFALHECAVALAALKRGETAKVPTFDVLVNRRIGTTEIDPADFVIWEGIYALGSNGIRNQVDLSIFVDTPYLVRLLRRIARFFNTRTIEQIDDFSTPVRQMLTFVWKAEKDFVMKQQRFADYCVSFDERALPAEVDNFTSTMLQRIPLSLRTPQSRPQIWEATWSGLQFILCETSFEIHKDSVCLYTAPIVENLMKMVCENLKDIIL